MSITIQDHTKKKIVNGLTVIHEFIINDDFMNEQLVNEIENSIDVQKNNTNVKAKMTDWWMMNNNGFKTLKIYTDEAIKKVQSLKSVKDYSFKLDNIWGVVYNKNQYTEMHDHWPATYSFVYYPNKHKDELYFTDLNYKVNPKKGLLVIFEGHIRHEVKNTNSEFKRYCISGNYHLIG